MFKLLHLEDGDDDDAVGGGNDGGETDDRSPWRQLVQEVHLVPLSLPELKVVTKLSSNVWELNPILNQVWAQNRYQQHGNCLARLSLKLKIRFSLQVFKI